MKNLEKAKLIKKQTGSSKSYNNCKESLRLINENVSKSNPDDCSYVFDGFCPITIRLIEAAIGKGWNYILNDLKYIPGQFKFSETDKQQIYIPNKMGKVTFILLVFIGGITYAEIAAIRHLNKTKKDLKFIMLTTHTLS